MFRFIYFLGNFFKFSKSQHFTNILTRIDPEKLQECISYLLYFVNLLNKILSLENIENVGNFEG